MRVMTGGQATIGGPTGKKPLITAEAPPAPGVPAHQGREEGALIDQWEDPKYEIYHMQDRLVTDTII